ncbi:S9 family peptidase [Fischerella sp. JS2]|uniref:alpha/beta hydrolase family protein n=1 Tax=Fischerella sp. JS2 TaxID=2597771 RepID=UPI0028F09CA7|nr:S9 family peptidase [Fischerella sp. JS2]
MADSFNTDQIWQSPPEPINQILNASPLPTIRISPNREWMVELERPSLLPIAELAQPKVPLAGLLINPRTNAPAHRHPFRRMKYWNITNFDTVKFVTLPENAQIGFLKWSLDSQKLAFTLTQPTGLELWILELTTGVLRRLTETILNAAYGEPYHWLSDDTLICKFISSDHTAAPVAPTVPPGPLIQQNLGEKNPVRTFTNLLKNPYDEVLFEYHLTSILEKVTLDGHRTVLVPPSLIYEAIPSPDSKFILIITLRRPFSYQVPVGYFPKKIQVIDDTGTLIYQVADVPLYQPHSTKFDQVRPGRRRIFWRCDRPATLSWLEALDEGDPTRDVPYRDALFELDAPFTDIPKQLWQSQYRFRGITWGRSDVALVWERWYDTRQERIWRIYPDTPEISPQLLFNRSYEDRYSDPGSPIMTLGTYRYKVLRFAPAGNAIYLSGRGVSPDGVHPFLDRLELETGETQRLWQCQDPYFEEIYCVLDNEARNLITCRQSQIEPPNYFLWSHTNEEPITLTHYPDPAPQFMGMQKEVVQYKRSDGVQLSATLYLPPNYDISRDGPLPMLFWVYPQEFKDREFAGQVTTAENAFIRPSRDSILFLLSQGYAVLANPKLPIIGEGDTEPNDTYVEQLIAGAQAAVDYVVERGVATPQKNRYWWSLLWCIYNSKFTSTYKFISTRNC